MKSSGRCIKCKHGKLWIIDRVMHSDGVDSSTRPWPMVVASHWFTSAKWFDSNKVDVGSFQIIICAACGYTEWYASDFERLKDIPGARLVGADAGDAGPYR